MRILYLLLIMACFELEADAQSTRFVKWLDDGHFITTQPDGKTQLQVDARTGKEIPYSQPATLESKLPKGVRATPANSNLSPSGQQLAVVDAGDLYLLSHDGTYRQLTANPEEEKTPIFSPDGTKLAYTRAHNLYVLDLTTGLERQLSSDGSDVILNGYASWVYWEEILGRGSWYCAFYWSPDSRQIAYLRFDDTPVPQFPIYHAEGSDMTHGFLEIQRYPKAGDPLPDVRLGIADIQSGKTTWVEQDPTLAYTAWVYWTPGNKLLFQQMNRDQNQLHLRLAEPSTGTSTSIYHESRPTWVEFFEDIKFLSGEQGFILRSFRNDWENLYHYDYSGKLVHQLTQVNWRITDVLHIDEANRKIYFAGTGATGTGTERHLFVAGLDGSGFRQLTQGAGTHQTTLSPGATYFADAFSSMDNPGTLHIREVQGKHVLPVGKAAPNPNADKNVKVELFTIPSTDGFNLPAYWVLPPNFDPSKKYPIIFDIYGGPDAGRISNSFRNYSNDKLLQAGVILFSVDHRASGKFGHKGMDYMHRNLGKWEIHDYAETVKWLRQQPFIDASRIGIRGGSYGGYMTAMALTAGADFFTHGVSSAPVIDWRLYDNVYTERYMDTPADNPEGYQAGSVVTYADKLKGKLLLIHGEIDDNVHLQNSMQLISKLQDLGKPFELMIYPGNRHGISGQKRAHSTELADQFWFRHFGLSAPK